MMSSAREGVLQSRSRGLTIISIAIFVGGIVFIALGVGVLNKTSKVSETAVQDYYTNKTSGVRSIIAKTVTDALTPYIQALTHVGKGIMGSMGAFFCLVGIGICVLGTGLFKVKYLAWVLTVVLMFLAIVIDVVGLGFVGGSLPSSSNEKGIVSADFAYVLIGILIVHLLANAVIIYYLTRKTTAVVFRT